MTVETGESMESGMADEQPGEPTVVFNDGPAKLAFRVGGLFLVAGLAALLLQALRLSAPDLLNVAGVSFGRLQPAAWGSLTFGWAVVAALGAAYYVVPRLVGPLRLAPLAHVSVLAVAVGTLIGIVAVLLLESAPGAQLEFPIYADALIIAGLVLGTGVVVETTRNRRAFISIWFYAASFVFGALGLLLANLPFDGLAHALSLRVGQASVWTLIIGGAVGTLYFLIPRAAGNAIYSAKLSAISFWTLFGVFGWIGPALMTYGPAPAWLDTIGALFAIATLVPVAAVLGNLGLTLQGRWPDITGSSVLTLSVASLASLALLSIHLMGLGVRSSSAVVQFTPWVEAGPMLVVAGVATFAFLALRVEAAGDRAVSWPLRGLIGAVFGLVLVLWINGLATGLTWLSGPNSQDFTNAGPGFSNTIVQQVGFDVVRWVLWIPIVAGAAFAYLTWTRWNDELIEPVELSPEPSIEVATEANDA